MFKRLLLPLIFLLLAYGFWLSPNFKEVTAGVAIFLFGMLSLEKGFRAFTGGTLEKILRRSTSRLWNSLSFGVVSTSIMQSSSLVSVLTISFLSAGLITLSAGIGIIFGANLGTTTGAWLVAGLGLKVKISAYAMPMLVFGVILLFQKSKTLKGLGYILSGLGFLFLGIHHMKEGFEAFKETINLAEFAVTGYRGLFIFTGIGIFATVVMQSSHATLVLIITALAAGQITYENALALAIGANIGTTVTAIIGAMSANQQGKRLAGAHLVFNMVTGLIAIVFISQLVLLVDNLSNYFGIQESDHTLKLAVFHTVFNLLGILIMLPFVQPLVRVLKKLFVEKKVEIDQPKHLTNSALSFPETTVEVVRLETEHLYDNALSIIIHGLGFRRQQVFSDTDLNEIAQQQTKVTKLDIDSAYTRGIKGIYGEIVDFISRADNSLHDNLSDQLQQLLEANTHIVYSVKDLKHLQKNLLFYGNGDNSAMQTAYSNLRVDLVGLLRELNQTLATEESGADLLALDTLKLVIKEAINDSSGQVSHLIRTGQITPTMGTSLLNDSQYAYSIVKNLIKTAQVLFISIEQGLEEAAASVKLDEEELDDLAKENNAPPNSSDTTERDSA